MKSIVPGGPAAKEGRILQGEEWSHAGLCILWGAEPRPVGEGCSLKFLAHSHSDTLCKWWPLKVMVSLPGKGDDLNLTHLPDMFTWVSNGWKTVRNVRF